MHVHVCAYLPPFASCLRVVRGVFLVWCLWGVCSVVCGVLMVCVCVGGRASASVRCVFVCARVVCDASKDTPNMIKFNPEYVASLQGGKVGRWLNPELGEWMHGLPNLWTDVTATVAAHPTTPTPERPLLRAASLPDAWF